MKKASDVIWLRFRSDRTPSSTQLFINLPLEAIDNVAAEKCLLMKSNDEKYSSGAINHFAKNLAGIISDSDDYSDFHADANLPSNVEKSIFELATVLYAHTLSFSQLTKDVLSNAILECVYEEKHGTAAYHVSIPGNIFDRGLLCPSVHMDAYLEKQRKIQYATMNFLSDQMFIIDDAIPAYEQVTNLTKSFKIDSPVSLFITSCCQDFSAACSLVLGGRLDAAYAVARRNIEILGAARSISDNTDAGAIWASAHKDVNSWKIFKRLFSVGNMFPKGDSLWDKIFGLYDLLAREHHPNPESFNKIKEVSRDDHSISFSVSSTSFDLEDIDKSAGAFRIVCYVFCMILVGYTKIFSKHLEKEQNEDLNKLSNHAREFLRKTLLGMRDIDKRSYGASKSNNAEGSV